MKVTILEYQETQESKLVDILFERTHGKYNSFTTQVELKEPELTKNQACTKAFLMYKGICIQMFNNVWECRNSPQHPMIEDIPEYDEEGNVVWAERVDKTPINEDTLPDALPPAEEPDEFIGFEFEALPPEPEKPYQATLEDKVAMLQATIDLLMMGGM